MISIVALFLLCFSVLLSFDLGRREGQREVWEEIRHEEYLKREIK